MAEKFERTKLRINNRRIFVFIFGVLALFFVVSAFSLIGQFPVKAQIPIQSRFQIIAKQLTESHSPQGEKTALNNLKNLNPNELVEVRKLWRNQLFVDKKNVAHQAKTLSDLEKFDAYFYQKVEERFGIGKNIFNVPKDQVLQLFNELNNNDTFIKSLINDIENVDNISWVDNILGIQSASAAGGNCEYVAAWPTWANAVWRNYYNNKPYNADRVKNDPNEWPCDFRLHITPSSYREVDGLTLAAWFVVSYHGGLSGSSSRDRYIVGYGSALIYGVPFEWYLRNYIIFRT